MKKSSYILLYFFGFILIMFMCYCGFNMSSVATFFGDGGSAELPILYEIIYHSNYPDGSVNLKEIRYGTDDYVLENNIFSVSGYDFLGWNVNMDGSGDIYYSDSKIDLDGDIEFYAIWEKVIISYGDVNLDLVVNDSDYLLLDSYILGNISLNKNAIRNADVNIDGKVDLVDVDIIKQFCLGTFGYVGMPDNPILKYEVYKDVVVEEGNVDEGNNKDNNGNSESVVVPNGSISNGSSGGGNSSSGSGNGIVSSNGNGSGNVNNNGGDNGNISDNDNGLENDNVNENEVLDKYEFRYMIGNLVYSVTECSDIKDGKCSLVLPKSIPNRDGYNFLGWSLDKECLDGNIINNSISVDKSNIYYACFKQDNGNDNSLYIWILVGIIWILVGILIYKVISNHRREASE